MTRKDYVLIADTIAGLVRDIAEEQFHARAHTDKAILSGERLGVHNVAQRLASKLWEDNYRFDQRRFIDACQLDAERLA
jgi:hypothetical protein